MEKDMAEDRHLWHLGDPIIIIIIIIIITITIIILIIIILDYYLFVHNNTP